MSWTRKKLFVGQETLPPQFINVERSNFTPCTIKIWSNKIGTITINNQSQPIPHIFYIRISQRVGVLDSSWRYDGQITSEPRTEVFRGFFASQNWRIFHPYIFQIFYVGGGFSRPHGGKNQHLLTKFFLIYVWRPVEATLLPFDWKDGDVEYGMVGEGLHEPSHHQSRVGEDQRRAGLST
jgi:hypothetical protein